MPQEKQEVIVPSITFLLSLPKLAGWQESVKD